MNLYCNTITGKAFVNTWIKKFAVPLDVMTDNEVNLRANCF